VGSKPVYRKVISPWYDSEPLCIGIIVMMLGVFLFACAGISVAGSQASWSHYLWIPIILAGLSLWVLFTTSVRLARRLIEKRSNASGL
jgi:hypothetical protein